MEKPLENASASPKKLALLIGSPYGVLRGVLNDVRLMACVLEKRGFDISICADQKATLDGIRKEWRELIEKCDDGDVVAIYYSGHGGIVESKRDPAVEFKLSESDQPWRY